MNSIAYMDAKAHDLETAWGNFDSDIPLPGDDHPFYVHRPGEPLKRLLTTLRLSRGKPPKLFFAGYRGSGKSTELNRVANSSEINERYWVARFSIKDTGDIQNLGYQEVLLALGAQMYTQYTETGKRLDPDLMKELETWKDRTVERLTSKGATFETGAGFDLSKFFLATLLKVKTEHETRELVREEIGPRVSQLINNINLITAGIQAQEKKPVLVLVDDLDKLNLDNARRLFYENLTTLMQPVCAIVYTLPVALIYEDVFMVAPLFQDAFLLPNICLHSRENPLDRDLGGHGFLATLIANRMDEALIDDVARDALIAISGGVPSDLVYAVQTAISNALHRDDRRVTVEDVSWARDQLRNPLLRLLSDEDVSVLRIIRRQNPDRLPDPKKHARLVHIRAVLQYANGLDWFDTHPSLDELLVE